MQASDACLDLIKRSEAWSAEPYLCPAAVWTIGWGSTHDLNGEPVSRMTPAIDKSIGELLLRHDIRLAELAVSRLITVPLSQSQFDALVDFVYNLGSGALQASTLRARLNRGQYSEVPAQLRRWVHGGGRVLPGLVIRREAEVSLWNQNESLQSRAAASDNERGNVWQSKGRTRG